MAFESLTEKLQNSFKKLRGKGRLTEADVKSAMREIKIALLEADVNFRVVKEFINSVEERSVGADVMNGLNPGQMVIKIVNEELTTLMGGLDSAEIKFASGKDVTVIMLCGLQGAGKTTTAAKIAGKLKDKGKRSMLAALDVYRPAAIAQLQLNGQKQEVPVFTIEGCSDVVKIAREAVEDCYKRNCNVLILDTAGRLHIDDDMMTELEKIKEAIDVHQTLLVVDAMTGQDAVNAAKEFSDRIGLDGVILSKMDGDARGGAALSVKKVTGAPIIYVGMGEKLSELEEFHADRMANRILGMGDILSLIEKVEQNLDIDEDKGKEMTSRMKKGKFDFEDYLESLGQMKKLGGIGSLLSMIPGLGMKQADIENAVNDKDFSRMEAIVLSMTKKERQNPKLLNPSRKFRIAKGAGVDIAVVNRFIKQFEQAQKMMKQMGGNLFGGKGRKGMGMPFGGLGQMGKF